jgi:hypothetical protein
MDRERLRRALLDGLIQYQYRLENPIPKVGETHNTYVLRYIEDRLFRSKVDSLVCGIMQIVFSIDDSHSNEDY